MKITLVRYAGTHVKGIRYSIGMGGLLGVAAQRGWRTCIVLSRPPEHDHWLDPFRENGVMVEYLPRPRRNFDLGCIRRAYDLCRRLNATVFHCDNMHSSPMLGAALARVPVRVWSKRSMQPAFEECRRPSWRERLAPSVRSTTHLATRVLAVSAAVRGELIELGLPASRVSVFPNACDRPEMTRYDRGAFRAAHGIEPSDTVVIAVGRAAPVKGWDILLDAFSHVSAGNPRARLMLVGSFTSAEERPLHTELMTRIAQRGLIDRVRFTGHVADVYDALVAADVFVMPSRSEGDPNALLQALSIGLPCIATRVGSAPDLIEAGVDGVLVERENVAAMAAAVNSLVSDVPLRQRIASIAASRSYAPTSEEYASRLVELYAEMLRQRGIIGCQEFHAERAAAPGRDCRSA